MQIVSVKKNDGMKWYSINTSVFGDKIKKHIFLIRDITSNIIFQQELMKKQKLAAIGTIAAGIAHELRNPLKTLKHYLKMAGSEKI